MSNHILFYDTETTGLLVNEAYDHPRQPHIVQIAALLVNSVTREIAQTLSLIAYPDGWVIPEAAIAVHGITMERAMREGIKEKSLLNKFTKLWHKAESKVAHNEQFDAQIVRVAQMRFNYSEENLELWRTHDSECTQVLGTNVLQLSPTANMIKAGYTNFKSPNLRESHLALLGYEFKNPHDALADTIACKKVYFALKDLELYGLEVSAPLFVQVLAASINRITEWDADESNKYITFYSKRYKLKISKADGSIVSDCKRLINVLALEDIRAHML